MVRRKWFDMGFLTFGLLVQVVTYAITLRLSPSSISLLSLISGCFGVCSVCLASQGNILTFFFGFAQVATYTYLCVTQRFYAEIAINAYYFATMIYGVFEWKKRLKGEASDEMTVTPRALSVRTITVLIVATYDNTCTRGAGIDDSRLSRALVPLARGGYTECGVMASCRRLLHGCAIYVLVR